MSNDISEVEYVRSKHTVRNPSHSINHERVLFPPFLQVPKTQRFEIRADNDAEEEAFYLLPYSFKPAFLALSGRQIQTDGNLLTLLDSGGQKVASAVNNGLQPVGRFEWKYENEEKRVFTFTACSKVGSVRTLTENHMICKTIYM